jgi:hypothetical protein
MIAASGILRVKILAAMVTYTPTIASACPNDRDLINRCLQFNEASFISKILGTIAAKRYALRVSMGGQQRVGQFVLLSHVAPRALSVLGSH